MSRAKKNTEAKNSAAELEGLRLPELQARFREVVGELTKSPNRKFLIRRIQETVAAQSAVPAEPEQPAEMQPAVLPQADTQVDLSQADTATTEPVTDTEAPAEPDEEPELAPGYEPPTDEELTQVHAPAKPGRGRFSGMSVAELQAKYLQVVGRPTGSDNTAYLIWKIREAEKGRITVGPVQPRKAEGTASDADVKILPLRLETKVVETMDAAWRDRGIKTRMEFFRRALGHYLTHLGATEAAALFAESK